MNDKSEREKKTIAFHPLSHPKMPVTLEAGQCKGRKKAGFPLWLIGPQPAKNHLLLQAHIRKLQGRVEPRLQSSRYNMGYRCPKMS